MLSRLLEIVMRQRAAVLLATLVVAAIGVWAALRLPIDAVPDITNPQVQINTGVPALAPEEVEKLVTFPIESEMAGLPDMVELRSLSKFGLSQVTMTFRDGIDGQAQRGPHADGGHYQRGQQHGGPLPHHDFEETR